MFKTIERKQWVEEKECGISSSVVAKGFICMRTDGERAVREIAENDGKLDRQYYWGEFWTHSKESCVSEKGYELLSNMQCT